MPTLRSGTVRTHRWARVLVASTAVALGATLALAAGDPPGDALYTVDDAEIVSTPWDVVAVSSDRSRFEEQAHGTQIVLARGDWASSSKRIDFGAPNRAIAVTFEIRIGARTSNGASGQVFRVGYGFSTANTDESDASTYGRIGLVATNAEAGFQLHDLGTRRASPEFQGTQAVTWALNRSGDALVYSAPDGTRESIANHRMDVWVGRTKVFDDIAVTNAKAGLSDFKWYWSGEGTASFSHLDVRTLEPAPAEVVVTSLPATTATALVEAATVVPALELYRPSPNPFSGAMRYAYAIPSGSQRVAIDVFDIGGRLVRKLVHGTQEKGQYQVVWDGLGEDGVRVRSTVYFLRASIGASDRVTRVILVK